MKGLHLNFQRMDFFKNSIVEHSKVQVLSSFLFYHFQKILKNYLLIYVPLENISFIW